MFDLNNIEKKGFFYDIMVLNQEFTLSIFILFFRAVSSNDIHHYGLV